MLINLINSLSFLLLMKDSILCIQIQDLSLQADELDSEQNLHTHQQHQQQQTKQLQLQTFNECSNKLSCRCKSPLVIDCSQLNLDRVPMDLQQDISSLNFTSNLLTDVQKSYFERYTQLRTLKLKRNLIKRLGDGAFYDLHSLESLSLDSNRLTEITGKWLFGLNNLQRLSMNHNRIANINGSFWSFSPNISYLSLTHNKLKRITKSYFQDLKSLLDLRLHHNNMTFIEPDSFSQMKHLKNLDLSNNKLEVVLQSTSGIFNGLVSLERLDLQHNEIDTIRADCFEPLINLRSLDMGSNPIRTLPQAAFVNLHRLTQFDMNSQRLNCDCDIEWLISVFNSTSSSNQISTIDPWIDNGQNNQNQLLTSQYQDSKLFLSKSRSISHNFDGHGEAACASPNSLRTFKVKDLVGEHRWRVKRPYCDNPGKPILLEDKPVNSSLFIKGHYSSLTCSASIPKTNPPEQTLFTWQKYVPGFGFWNVQQTYAELAWRLVDPKDETREIVETTLEKYNIDEGDSGEYQCVVSNRFGNAYSRTINMTTYIYPYFTYIPRNTVGRTDGSVDIMCGTAGHPSPSLSWSFFDKDNKRRKFPAAEEKRLNFTRDGNGVQTLKVWKLSLDDEGTYSCVSTSAIGVAYANFTISVNPYQKGPRQRSIDNTKLLSIPTKQALVLRASADVTTWVVILFFASSISITVFVRWCLVVKYPKTKPEPILTIL